MFLEDVHIISKLIASILYFVSDSQNEGVEDLQL